MAQLLPSPFPCCLKMPLLVVRQLTAIKCKQACCKMISFTWQTRKSKFFSFCPFAHKNGGYVKASFHSKLPVFRFRSPLIWEFEKLLFCVTWNRLVSTQIESQTAKVRKLYGEEAKVASKKCRQCRANFRPIYQFGRVERVSWVTYGYHLDRIPKYILGISKVEHSWQMVFREMIINSWETSHDYLDLIHSIYMRLG